MSHEKEISKSKQKANRFLIASGLQYSENYNSIMEGMQVVNTYIMLTKLSIAKAMKLCIISGESMHQYHTHIEEFLESKLKETMDALINRLLNVLNSTLVKLKRYDEGSLLKSLLTLTVSRILSFFSRLIIDWTKLCLCLCTL